MGSGTYRGHILGGEFVGCVGDEEAGFTHSTVTHYHTLNGLHSCVLLGSSELIQDLAGRKQRVSTLALRG